MKPFEAAEIAQLERLAALREEEIDTADIPEAPAESWRHARRGAAAGRPTFIRVEPDVLAWFRDHTPGGDAEGEINRVLRRHLEQAGLT